MFVFLGISRKLFGITDFFLLFLFKIIRHPNHFFQKKVPMGLSLGLLVRLCLVLEGHRLFYHHFGFNHGGLEVYVDALALPESVP